uniref:Uncharacterized protein n=1 Tax=Rhizophora mucronata TaxID=61149 RepID=A0A2P2NCR6_RHIMU
MDFEESVERQLFQSNNVRSWIPKRELLIPNPAID